MEKLYRKKENGRYEEYTYGYNGDLSDGIWIVQKKPQSKSFSSLFWKVGDLKRPVDVTTHSAIQSMGDELSTYLMRLGEQDSKEFSEAKKMIGGFLRGPIYLNNISVSDLTQLFLRKIALIIEDDLEND